MSKATYWQRGESLDYRNTMTKTIDAGTVVALKSRIGVIGGDILPGEMGTVHMTGVFEITKTDANEIPMGTLVFFDGTGITATAGTDTPAGYAATDAAAGDNSIIVKLLG
jgi:predicted RecA/RadA family phage recombinase